MMTAFWVVSGFVAGLLCGRLVRRFFTDHDDHDDIYYSDDSPWWERIGDDKP